MKAPLVLASGSSILYTISNTYATLANLITAALASEGVSI